MLTGVPHYFMADFIDKHEEAARDDTVTLHRARVLLDAVATSRPRHSAEWRGHTVAPDVELAGRGLKSGPQDAQILEALRSGEITMPLWGLSLDRGVAASFGDRFLFLVEGPFHGVAAWFESGIKESEQEIITGGRYKVLSSIPKTLDDPATIVVRLRELETVTPPDRD